MEGAPAKGRWSEEATHHREDERTLAQDENHPKWPTYSPPAHAIISTRCKCNTTGCSKRRRGGQVRRVPPSGEKSEVGLREVSGNGCTKITDATRPDGTTTADPAEIAAIFRDCFVPPSPRPTLS
ncbi:hypothetical protein MTO96_029537 [Rhipicephalus appendiculatus]